MSLQGVIIARGTDTRRGARCSPGGLTLTGESDAGRGFVGICYHLGRMKTLSIAFALLVTAVSASAQPNASESNIKQVLSELVEAQRSFDLAKLDALLAPDYIEISPLGEVDPRAKVLTFYTPDKKISDTPIATLDEFITRVYGDTAVTIARLTYQMKGPDGTTASRSMRCVFVTRSMNGKWKIASSQFTPMRN